MFVSFFRWIKGYVRFKIIGFDVGELLSKAIKKGKIFGVKEEGGFVCACADIPTYKSACVSVRKAGGRLKIISKHGPGFYFHKKRKRKGIIIGIALFFTLLFVLSRFVWSVEIRGADPQKEEAIKNSLTQNGVKVGALKSSIDVKSIKHILMIDNKEISFIAINIVGTRVVVEIDSAVKTPDVTPKGVFANVIAKKDGEIIRMEVYDGRAEVMEKQNVLRGDLIVSGTIEDRWGRTIFTRADAKVFAKTQNKITVKIPVTQDVAVETGKIKKKRYISLFNLTFPFHLNFFNMGKYHNSIEGERITIFGVPLPIYYTEVTMKEVKYKTVTYEEDALYNSALDILEAESKDVLKNTEILECELMGRTEEGFYILEGTYTCIEDIGLISEIEVDTEYISEN